MEIENINWCENGSLYLAIFCILGSDAANCLGNQKLFFWFITAMNINYSALSGKNNRNVVFKNLKKLNKSIV